jgi:hypothetical protein
MGQRVGTALLLGMVVLLLVRAAGGQGTPRGDDVSFSPGSASLGDHHLVTQGVLSCASTACHHRTDVKGRGRNEYTTWVAQDPHARAYAVLFEAPAQQIVKNLHGPTAKPAADNLLCLNCHVQPGLQGLSTTGSQSGRLPRPVLADGVGCESCHGPAEKWLKTHYLEDWKQKTPEAKAGLGFRDTKDLVVRARICVTCHVGGGNLDVNHKLIAAGHPRLRFEYSAYLANLPKHWDEQKDRRGRPNFDLRVWEIGQVVSMQAALQLLGERATMAGKPWPELAEYDCFACHHVLADAKWRRNPKYLKDQPPGSPPWGSWYYAMANVVADHPPQAPLKLPATALQELRRLMQPPYSNAKKDQVGKYAREAAKQLAGWFPSLRQPTSHWNVPSLTNALDEKARKEMDSSSWDQAAQLYLAQAAQRSLGHRKELLSVLWRNLEFTPQV